MLTNFFLRGFKERGRRQENKDQADPDYLHSRAAGVPGGGVQEVPVHGGPGQALLGLQTEPDGGAGDVVDVMCGDSDIS